MKSLNLSEGSIRSYIGYIIRYSKWAIENKVKLNNKIPAENITTKQKESIAAPNEIYNVDFIYELVGKSFAMGKEPEYDLKQLDNIQDQLAIYLAFLGVRGNRESELRNLKLEHVDFDNKILKLSELDPYRKDISIDDYAIELINLASKEDYYYRRLSTTDKSTYGSMLLNDSSYIFRGAKRTDNDNNDSVLSPQALMKRIKSTGDYIGYPIKLKKIEYAGMLYVAHMLEQNGENLDARNPIIQRTIFDRYNMSTVDGVAERKHLNIINKIKKDLKEVYPTVTV
jgi:integrase